MIPYLLLALVVLSTGFSEDIADLRRLRDMDFANPLTSPLATIAIAKIDEKEMDIGSHTTADLRINDPSIRPRHARLTVRQDQYVLQAIEGSIRKISDSQPSKVIDWQPNEQVRLGRFLLWLQIHPVSPVIRVLESESSRVKSFKGLDYFPIDRRWNLTGTIAVQPMTEHEMIDTQGWQRKVYVYGKVIFVAEGKEHNLDLILFTRTPGEKDKFMLIFQDATSGKESYPACRYLWIPFQNEGQIEVDFNRAVNPTCAYGGGYACPLPLPGNRLNIAVRAGEKTYH